MQCDAQAKLYYLYMMADGEVSSNEKNLFSSICKKLNLDSYDKKNIIRACEVVTKDEGLTCMEVVKKNVEEGIFMYGYSDIDLNKWEIDQEKMSVLWNLINLGYADTYFSSEEREVVEYIKEYWEISDSLYKEMIDVAETCLSLEKYKKWVESLPESDFKSEKLKKIKKDLKYVQKTIKTTISEVEF